jgi:hypothetical protein
MNTALEARLARSASWFYWIAALSLINAFTINSGYVFFLGSGVVEAAPAFGQTAMIVIDAVVVGGFALFGFLGSRRQTWAMAIGMILYAGDGALYLFAKDYLAAAFHAYVLFVLFLGVQASIALNRLPVETRTMVMPHATAEPTVDAPAPNP